MNIIYLLIPLALLLFIAAAIAFWWAVGNGQYDDLESPAHHILFDDDEQHPS
jgi:cbb3-type cytochrome oxidase maturation protein